MTEFETHPAAADPSPPPDDLPETAGPASDIESRIRRATQALLRHQRPDGHFCFELEADATIPSEYVLLLHWLGEENRELEAKIGRYLRETGMPETKFGRLAVHDPRLVGDLRRGRRLGPRVAARVDAFIAEHRP